MPAQRRIELLSACSIELSPRDGLIRDGLDGLFKPGTTVFVNYPPSVSYHDVLDACVRLQRAGFIPVPHVVARLLTSFTQANDFLRRAADAANVSQVLLLGGDAAKPVGPFSSALDLLSTGVVERHGLTEIAFAGYPDGHPSIDTAVLEAALTAKLELARQRGLATTLVTQFGFEPEPILHWIAAKRARGITCPIRVGVAGPASIATLAKYAVRCGIGASLRALTRGHAAIARVMTEANPDSLIDALVAREDAAAPIDGLHVFTFGGAKRTAAWRTASLPLCGRGRVTSQREVHRRAEEQ